MAFEQALARGLGRCVLAVRAGQDHRDALLGAFRRNLAYDPQCEQERTPWLFTLAEGAAMLDELRAAALEGLPGCEHRWDLDQHAGVLLELARQGDEACAEVLRTTFDAAAPGGPTFDTLAWSVLHLDGAAGLQRVAGRPGLARGTVEWIRSEAEELLGASVSGLLAEWAATDRAVAPWLEEPRPSPERAWPSLVELVAEPSSASQPWRFVGWARAE